MRAAVVTRRSDRQCIDGPSPVHGNGAEGISIGIQTREGRHGACAGAARRETSEGCRGVTAIGCGDGCYTVGATARDTAATCSARSHGG